MVFLHQRRVRKEISYTSRWHFKAWGHS
jgi:hypothetical protein